MKLLPWQHLHSSFQLWLLFTSHSSFLFFFPSSFFCSEELRLDVEPTAKIGVIENVFHQIDDKMLKRVENSALQLPSEVVFHFKFPAMGTVSILKSSTS